MKQPSLEKVAEGVSTETPLVFVKGYLSKNDDIDDWCASLRAAGWRGSIHRLHWDSSTASSLAANVTAVTLVSKAVLLSVLLPPPLNLVGGSGLLWAVLSLRRHWKKHLSHATSVGKEHLPRLLDGLPGDGPVTMVGFSLGCKVVLESLGEDARRNRSRVADAVLVGAAVPVSDEAVLRRASRAVNGGLVNVYNSHDTVLSRLYRVAEMGKKACGTAPVPTPASGLTNINGTRAMRSFSGPMQSHLGWAKAFGTLRESLPWTTSKSGTQKHR